MNSILLLLLLFSSTALSIDSHDVNPSGPTDPGSSTFPPRQPTQPVIPILATPAMKAKGEIALRSAYKKYVEALDRAQERYNTSWAGNDSISQALASDQLYYDEILAELDFWDAADIWSKAIGATTWAVIGVRVGKEVAAKSTVVQAKVAALVALISFMQLEMTARAITEKKEHYQRLAVKQRELIDIHLKHLLWQSDYGGHGGPGPNSDLQNLFPTCQIQTTCIDAMVCTPSGGQSNCEKQTICTDRIVKC